MLLVLLATVLSASAAIPVDSVRVAAKPGSVRPDSALSTLPIPTITVPSQPALVVAAPVARVTTIGQPLLGSRTVTVAAAPQPLAEVVQQAAPAIAGVAPADAVAVTHAAVTTTRVDARTVVSVKSSERIEPLYAVPLPANWLRPGAPTAADSIVVYKRERTLTLFYRGVPVRSYFVALGSKPVGDKERVGDQRTPEGLFHVNAHNPASKFHLALRISYPDDAHRARAAALGVDPGGDIMIHGLPKEYSIVGKDHRLNDWTNGCVALSNPEIEEIWYAVPDGTPVQIKP
jgi:hypothetical protein